LPAVQREAFTPYGRFHEGQGEFFPQKCNFVTENGSKPKSVKNYRKWPWAEIGKI
jgi:hypothetical protein